MDKDLLTSLCDQGISLRGIAKKLDRSYATIRYWFNKYGIHTKCYRINKPNQRNCSKCGELLTDTNSYRYKSGYRKEKIQSYCKKCNSKEVLQRQRNNKRRSVEYKGGKCQICGYNSCDAALEFHHINPEEKDYNPASLRLRKWEKQLEELDKCVLLCSNCHREVHEKLRINPEFDVLSNLT